MGNTWKSVTGIQDTTFKNFKKWTPVQKEKWIWGSNLDKAYLPIKKQSHKNWSISKLPLILGFSLCLLPLVMFVSSVVV